MISQCALSRALIPVLAAGMLSTALADGFSRSELLARSPFLGTGVAAPSTAAPGGYELRGFFGPEASIEVSIRKKVTGEARWIRVGDAGEKWRVESADSRAGTAVLFVDGVRFQLRLATEEGDLQRAFLRAGPIPHKRTDGRDYDYEPNGLPPASERAREDKMGRLRAEHPEYFTDLNAMSDEQRRVAINAINEANRQAMASAGGNKP